MPSEDTYTRARPDCPHPERWSAYDEQATEWEVIDLVAALVGALQPDIVLETGTYNGWMAQRIGTSLAANGQGRLVTIETDADRHAHAVELCAGLPVDCVHGSSLDVTPEQVRAIAGNGHVGFVWLDSLVQLRVREFEHFGELFDTRTIVGIHDTAPHHGPWSQEVRSHPRLRSIDLPTPRGAILAQVRF